MSSKKKGVPVPLNQFLQPDTKITSWAEDEDFDADSKFPYPSSLLLPDTVGRHCMNSRISRLATERRTDGGHALNECDMQWLCRQWQHDRVRLPHSPRKSRSVRCQACQISRPTKCILAMSHTSLHQRTCQACSRVWRQACLSAHPKLLLLRVLDTRSPICADTGYTHLET